MSKNKQTAVDFYRENLMGLVSTGLTKFKTETEIYDQAKAMHEEQMGLCFLAGDDSELQDVTFEQYYRETYENSKD